MKNKFNFFLYYLGNSYNEGELLDIYLLAEARRLNKTVGSLETPEDHCEVIDNLFVFFISNFYLSFLERAWPV